MARPKRVFTEHEEALIANYALDGGKNNTIANALCIPVNTLTNRFSALLKEYRAFRWLKLRRNQTRLSETSADMCKFLGVNELGQQIKQTIKTEQQDSKPKTGLELEAVKDAAKAYNDRMSRQPELLPYKGKEGA